MGNCCSQNDTVENSHVSHGTDNANSGSNNNNNIAKAPLLNNEVGGGSQVYDNSVVEVDNIENNNNSNGNSVPITMPIEKIKLTKTDSIDNECIVCFEKFSKLHPAVIKKCKCGPNTQNYHLSCILSWQERSEVCPVCRCKVEMYTE